MTHAEHHHSIRPYILVYLALIALLVATVGIAYIHLGALNLLVAMAIAIVKSGLVIWWFMHVKDSHPLVIAFGALALAMLGVCGILTMSDYMTRW